MKLKKRVALITGAGRGIGSALAIELAKENNHVILVGRSVESLEFVKIKIESNNGTASVLVLDVTHYDKIDKLGEYITEKFGRLDILILNAGVLGSIGPLKDQDPSVFFDTININLISVQRLIRSISDILLKGDAPRALIIGSGSAISKRPFMGGYAISKAGLEHLGYLWAAENNRTNLNINIIDPGATRTKMRSDAIPNENPNSLPLPTEVAKKIVPFTRKENKKHGERIKIRDIL